MQNLDSRLQNKWWRLTHLYKIKTKTGNLVVFSPNTIQSLHLTERADHRYNKITKYRQGGMTTLYAIDLLDEALWVPGTTCALIAHEAKKLPDYFEIIKRAYENLPEGIKPRTKTDTKHKYDFQYRFDGAILDSSIYVATNLRGGTVQNLHITESAYIKDRSELITGSKQAVPLSGRISEETTGNGFDDYYDEFMFYHNKQEIGEMDYKTYFYPWYIDPSYSLNGSCEGEYDEAELNGKEKFGWTDGQILWRRWKKEELRKTNEATGLTGDQLFKQEYPSTLQEAFQSGHGNIFSGEKLDALEGKRPIDKAHITSFTQNRDDLDKFYRMWQLGLNVWVLPEIGHEYVVGVDPSDGGGADSSCVDIWDRATDVQVAQFYGKCLPDNLAEITKEFADYYNHAFVGIENNMLSTILFFSKIYDNYYYTSVVDEKTSKRTKKIGWNTNTKTRDLMIDDFIIAFEEGSLTINSEITIREMKTFVKKENGKREHADGKHDDALFGAFIAGEMKRFFPKPIRVFANKPQGF